MVGDAFRAAGRPGLAVLMLAVTAVSVTGCGFVAPHAGARCAWMSQPPQAGGRTAILVDTSASTRAVGTSAGAPDYATALRDSVRSAVDRRDAVSVAAFSGTEADLAWSLRDMSTDWRSGNPNADNQRDRRDEAVGCLDDAVARAQSAPPRAPDTDVLRAVSSAADWLRQGSGPRHLVVATDGLVTTGCASLVRARFAAGTEIDAIDRACRDAAEVRPDELAGVDVSMVGVGRPAPHQPVPTPAQVQWLVRLWQRLCADAGGRCQVGTASAGGVGDSPAPAPVPSVPDPVVPFGAGTRVYRVPAAGLFDTGQWVVRPVAVPLLVDIAVAARTEPDARVTVNGYADPRGSVADNQVLSQRRADAVRDVLVANGVTNVEAHGLGETTACPDSGPAGTGTGADLPCARRVDIVVTNA